MKPDDFQQLLSAVTDFIAEQPILPVLAATLNQQFPPNGELFNAIEAACHQAIADGWMCTQGSEGRRFGRVVEPCDATSEFSIDVVDLTNFVGPHHRHPRGEVCMTLPVTEGAQFDGGDRDGASIRQGQHTDRQ